MRRPLLLIFALAAGGLAGCGGGGGSSPPPGAPLPATSAPASAPASSEQSSPAPGVGGLERSIAAARATVVQSQQDAQRASATSGGQ